MRGNIKNILVSIVIVAYNHKKYVCNTIQSVINQTYQNWKLIIIDDGLTDKIRDVIESFCMMIELNFLCKKIME